MTSCVLRCDHPSSHAGLQSRTLGMAVLSLKQSSFWCPYQAPSLAEFFEKYEGHHLLCLCVDVKRRCAIIGAECGWLWQDKKGKGKAVEEGDVAKDSKVGLDVLLELLSKTLCKRSTAHLEAALNTIEVPSFPPKTSHTCTISSPSGIRCAAACILSSPSGIRCCMCSAKSAAGHISRTICRIAHRPHLIMQVFLRSWPFLLSIGAVGYRSLCLSQRDTTRCQTRRPGGCCSRHWSATETRAGRIWKRICPPRASPGTREWTGHVWKPCCPLRKLPVQQARPQGLPPLHPPSRIHPPPPPRRPAGSLLTSRPLHGRAQVRAPVSLSRKCCCMDHSMLLQPSAFVNSEFVSQVRREKKRD